jgi:opacity protein-like surface antigen
MKKVLMIAVAACFIGSAANAQDVYKQTGGEGNVEVLFAPLGGNPIGINGIKYRKFTEANRAWRAEAFLGFNTSTDIVGEFNNNDLTDKRQSFDLELAFGIENHLPGTDRLSPYWGYEGRIGFGTNSRTTESVGFNADFEEALQEDKRSDGFFSIGAFGIAGFDYYFAHNIYLGAELGVGARFITDFDTKFESSVGSESVSSESPNGSSLSFGPVVQGRLRLGVLF